MSTGCIGQQSRGLAKWKLPPADFGHAVFAESGLPLLLLGEIVALDSSMRCTAKNASGKSNTLADLVAEFLEQDAPS
jgi:hypothetical protein